MPLSLHQLSRIPVTCLYQWNHWTTHYNTGIHSIASRTRGSVVGSWRLRSVYQCCGYRYTCADMITHKSRVTLTTVRPEQNGRYFPNDIFKRIFLKENINITIQISLWVKLTISQHWVTAFVTDLSQWWPGPPTNILHQDPLSWRHMAPWTSVNIGSGNGLFPGCHYLNQRSAGFFAIHQWPLLLTWFNFNPGVDK